MLYVVLRNSVHILLLQRACKIRYWSLRADLVTGVTKASGCGSETDYRLAAPPIAARRNSPTKLRSTEYGVRSCDKGSEIVRMAGLVFRIEAP